jgi:hypothetical protein
VRLVRNRLRLLVGLAVALAGVALLMWFGNRVTGMIVSLSDMWRIEFINRAQALLLGLLFGIVMLVSGLRLCFEVKADVPEERDEK